MVLHFFQQFSWIFVRKRWLNDSFLPQADYGVDFYPKKVVKFFPSSTCQVDSGVEMPHLVRWYHSDVYLPGRLWCGFLHQRSHPSAERLQFRGDALRDFRRGWWHYLGHLARLRGGATSLKRRGGTCLRHPKSHRKPMEHPWKTHGKPMEHHRIPIENPWKTIENPIIKKAHEKKKHMRWWRCVDFPNDPLCKPETVLFLWSNSKNPWNIQPSPTHLVHLVIKRGWNLLIRRSRKGSPEDFLASTMIQIMNSDGIQDASYRSSGGSLQWPLFSSISMNVNPGLINPVYGCLFGRVP